MEDQIKRIEDKVQQLLKAYQHAQKEIQRLQKENAKLTEQLTIQTEKAKELHQKADALTINGRTGSDSSKKDLEKRINIYLKDIEKCLALLHS